MQIKAKIKGAANLQKFIDAQHKAEVKAFHTAVKVEGHRLSQELKKEIRAGAFTGGHPKSGIDRKLSRTPTPLKRLALGVRYYTTYSPTFQVAVGWTGPRVSRSWKAIATEQQEGFTRPVTASQRSFLRHRGAELTGRSKFKKYFFLKKSTTEMTTPARPIITPFWHRHEHEAMTNIRNNYLRKLRGQRI